MTHQPVPRLSVVIPTYNRAGLLHRQLECLARQTLPPDRFEVVVADDGSDDDTAEVAASFGGKLRMGWHTQEDLGFRAAATRNAGARLATAPLLVFLDTGALVGPGFLEAHLAAHRDLPNAAGGGRLVLGYGYAYNPYYPFPGLAEALAVSDPEDVVRENAARIEFQDLRHTELAAVGYDLGRLAAPWMNVWALNMSLAAEDFHAVGGFDEDYRSWGGEDLEFGYRIHERGLPIVMSRHAWALESPHERDLDANRVSNCVNAWLLWHKHPAPVTELYGAMYSRNHYDPPLEYEYGRLLEWRERCAERDVGVEVDRHLAAALPDGRRASRVVVLGAGGWRPPSGTGMTCTVADFDERLLAAAPAGDGTTLLHALGLRTALETGSADLVVLTSRLRGVWERWSGDLLAEARRIGTAVRTDLPDGEGPR